MHGVDLVADLDHRLDPYMSRPAIVTLALRLYGRHARARSVHRRRALTHELLCLLDSMLPAQQDSFYTALQEMRAAGRDTPLVSQLPQRTRKIR